MTKSKTKKPVWICSQCAARHPCNKKPARCKVCGAAFVDVKEIER
jgi:rubrerythrin